MMKNNKLTFFENIYYCLWRYLPKSKQWDNDEPAPYISYLFSLLRLFNGGFLLVLVLMIIPISAVSIQILYKDYTSTFCLILAALGLLLLTYDEKRYEKNRNRIAQKVEKLTPKQGKVRIVIFVFYVILSIGFLFLIPTLLNITHAA